MNIPKNLVERIHKKMLQERKSSQAMQSYQEENDD